MASRPPSITVARLARLRVPLGFVSAVLAFVFADPAPSSIAIGMTIAATGESLRIWAAGHIEKGREVTRSGPYALIRHPLYMGSTIMGIGFMVAARTAASAFIAGLYLALTLTSAIRTEEALLTEKFAGEYAAYREGRAAPYARAFSFARVKANREHRTVLGLIAVGVLLWMR